VKDLLEKLVTLVPKYVGDIIRLTSGPKQFLMERVSTGEARWADGLIFLAISFVLAFLIGLPLARADADPMLDLASEGVFVLLYVVLYGYAVYLSWRVRHSLLRRWHSETAVDGRLYRGGRGAPCR